MMSLLTLIVLLIIIGVILAIVPMEARVKQIVIAIICIAVVLWLLQALGIWSGAGLR
jgi:hypothetical protein